LNRLLSVRYENLPTHQHHRPDNPIGHSAGASAHYLYEQHLSSGYAPIFKAAMAGTYDERTQYIHEAREFVRTDKDQETEAEMEFSRSPIYPRATVRAT
jgi:hypothetical protein